MLTVTLAFAAAACRSASSDNRRVATLAVIDSLELVGTDSAYVARPGGLAITRDGQILVADNGQKTIWRFDPTGRLLDRFGKPGDGPGELRSASDLVVVGDSLVAVNNVGRRQIDLFSLATGTFVLTKKVPVNVLSIRASHDTVLAGAVYPDGSHSVTSIPLKLSELTAAGPVPIILARHPILIAPFGTVIFDNRNQDRVAAFEASDWLFHWSTDAAVDSVMMPKVRRRGARTDLLMATAADTTRGREALFKSSMPMYVRFVSDRTALVIHGDLEFSRSSFTGTFFASVVDVGAKSVGCSDLLIPVPIDPLPRFFSRSDTLFAIVQHSEGRTFVVRLRIPLDACHL